MSAVPYLFFNDQCAEAFEFYADCLGGQIDSMQTHVDSPIADEVSPDRQDKILHAQVSIGDTILMGSDSPPEYYEKPQGFSISLQVDEPTEAERIFNKLADGGTVRMPFEQTFWAKGFGMVVDRFGTPWMVNCE